MTRRFELGAHAFGVLGGDAGAEREAHVLGTHTFGGGSEHGEDLLVGRAGEFGQLGFGEGQFVRQLGALGKS